MLAAYDDVFWEAGEGECMEDEAAIVISKSGIGLCAAVLPTKSFLSGNIAPALNSKISFLTF